MSKTIRLVFLCTVLLGCCVTETAFAEAPVKTDTSKDGDYSYQFSDEDLLGGTLNGMGDMYRGRPHAVRVMLLRPRTSLIQEILKSVENL